MRQIIYAWNYLEWGGAQIHVLALAKIAREKFEPVVVLPYGSSEQLLDFLKDLNIRYEFFPGHMDLAPAPNLRRKLQRHWRKIKCEYAMLKHLLKFDLKNSIVHLDLSPHQSMTFIALLLCCGTRVFTTSHNSLPEVAKWRKLLWKLKFRIISCFSNFRVFCSNEDTKLYFRKLYSQRVGDQIEVTYTSVHPDEIEEALAVEVDKGAQLERFNIPKDKFIVLAVGQFIDRKGRWTFLKAAEKLHEQDKDIAFVWLTPKMPSEADMENIRNFNLENSFQLILSEKAGKQRRDVLSFFRIADVFALPSYVEGLPIGLLEAMALKIPSISTNINGIPEAILHLDTGLLIEPGDSTALAEAILMLKNDDELRERISRRGSEYVIEHFDERKAANVALAAYLECFPDAVN